MLTWRHPSLGDKLHPGERVAIDGMLHECRLREQSRSHKDYMRMWCGRILPAEAITVASLGPVTCLWCVARKAR